MPLCCILGSIYSVVLFCIGNGFMTLVGFNAIASWCFSESRNVLASGFCAVTETIVGKEKNGRAVHDLTKKRRVGLF